MIKGVMTGVEALEGRERGGGEGFSHSFEIVSFVWAIFGA